MAVESHEPLTKISPPPGATATDMTSPPWSEKVVILSPLSTSQKRHVESPELVRIRLGPTKRQQLRYPS